MMMTARSSAGSEHRIPGPEVAGSSPAERAKLMRVKIKPCSDGRKETMANWRVVVRYDTAHDMPLYTLEDVNEFSGGLFVKHVPPLPTGYSIKELRKELAELTSALDKPVLVYRPAHLEEKKK